MSYIQIKDTVWPDPNDPDEVEWRLRHGTPTRSDLLIAASFMHAYRTLVHQKAKWRNEVIVRLKTPQREGER